MFTAYFQQLLQFCLNQKLYQSPYTNFYPSFSGNKGKGKKNKKKDMNKEKDKNPNDNSIDCIITRWSEWSECSTTCGKSYKSKTRMVKRHPENGGKQCPQKLVRRKRCREVPKCKKGGRRKNKDDGEITFVIKAEIYYLCYSKL